MNNRSFHVDNSFLFFFVVDENLSALFTNAIVFPLGADLSRMANIEDGSGG